MGSFQDWPWPLQALLYVALAFVIVAAGFYVPGSPIAGVRNDLQTAQSQLKPLEQEVASLRLYKQRKAELESDMDALQKQLATLQTIVPEDKDADQFILMIQRAAASSGVLIRAMAAKPITPKQYYSEMPFDVEADGPYYGVLDFFSQLGRLSRIINVGDLKLSGLKNEANGKFRLTPGSTVTGEFMITTFFTQGEADQAPTPKTAGRR
ncbi:MAG TPA: type 4a pilus biogenesis protein PilO [Candidatus Acidoferrum sp.]|nr:type 4a pilus biogenesis protein PilO [Candidatus Acidoferrum sp.]